MPVFNKHILAMLAPAWGHTISYIHFMHQLLRMDEGLVITIVQHNLLVPKMISELAGTSHDTQRVRIIGVGSKESSGALKAETIFVAMQELANDWLATLPSLFCEVDEKWPKPNSIYLDFACGGSTAPVVSILSHLSDHDFLAIAEEIYADESKRNGRSLDEILHQVFLAANGSDKLSGRILRLPGGPDIYDHERQAYGAGAPFGTQMFTEAQKLAKHVDGFVVTSSVALEPLGVPYCREFYRGKGQEFFAVGIQADEHCWRTENGRVVTLFNECVKNFLDGAAGKYGHCFFPVATPHLVEALVDTLLTLDQPFPFIFALGGQMASLPPSLIDRVHKSGKGLICDFWVEQRAILQHGAVGWFLTHGGANSLSESLTQGIPLIIWPVAAEQPLNAALFSAEPNPVAIELFQIRTGPHIGPSLHTEASITGTIEDATKEFKATFNVARGPRGKILQNNAAKLAESLRQERENEIPKELERLIHF
ncbi:hypothetical protein R3P38DRAFT_3325149 [Favolaschia claudopus]|uniref:Glycosyltransferase n=1 Tax=Favolaschia claudopus TaxID=2862362 RepID=A0AAW0AEU9_9AGAR